MGTLHSEQRGEMTWGKQLGPCTFNLAPLAAIQFDGFEEQLVLLVGPALSALCQSIRLPLLAALHGGENQRLASMSAMACT